MNPCYAVAGAELKRSRRGGVRRANEAEVPGSRIVRTDDIRHEPDWPTQRLDNCDCAQVCKIELSSSFRVPRGSVNLLQA